MTSPAYEVIDSSWDMGVLPPGPLHDLHDYWKGKRGPWGLPRRRDIDPLEIPRLLKYLLLLDIETLEPLRYRVRLAGTNFRQFFGRDLTGLSVDESQLDGGLALMCRDWREVLRLRQPRWASIRQHVGRDGMDHVRFTGLALPLSRDGKAADMLLVATLYHPDRP